MKYILFFLSLLPFFGYSQTYYRIDSIIDYGGDAALKRYNVSIEVIKDTSFITARRLEIERQITDLENELLYLNDLQAQFEDIMGGMSIMRSNASSKTPAKKPVAPKKQPANSNTKPSKPKKQ